MLKYSCAQAELTTSYTILFKRSEYTGSAFGAHVFGRGHNLAWFVLYSYFAFNFDATCGGKSQTFLLSAGAIVSEHRHQCALSVDK